MLSQMEAPNKACEGQGSKKIEDTSVPEEVFSWYLKKSVLTFQSKHCQLMFGVLYYFI